jgi:hypothetical protein
MKESNAKLLSSLFVDMYSLDIPVKRIMNFSFYGKGSGRSYPNINIIRIDNLLLSIFLYQSLPQFIPKGTIQFNTKLHELMRQGLEVSNPCGRQLSFIAAVEGSRDFQIKDPVLHVPAKVMNMTYVSRNYIALIENLRGRQNYLLNSQVASHSRPKERCTSSRKLLDYV